MAFTDRYKHPSNEGNSGRVLYGLSRLRREKQEGDLEKLVQGEALHLPGPLKELESKLETYDPPYQGRFPIIRLSQYLMGKGLFGWCNFYKKVIAILDSLKGEGKDVVEEHEKHHEMNMHHDEYKTRVSTSTVGYEPHDSVSGHRAAA